MRASLPPTTHNTIVSWMWCFNLSELRWHISNKWFLGAAVHTRSNSRASLYLNDWFLDFRLSGCASEGSCQPPKCMKLYYAAHFENVCTTFFFLKQIKRAVKLGEKKQRGLKRSGVFFFAVKSCLFSPKQGKQLLVPFSFGICAARCRLSLSQQRERVSLTASQTKWRH